MQKLNREKIRTLKRQTATQVETHMRNGEWNVSVLTLWSQWSVTERLALPVWVSCGRTSGRTSSPEGLPEWTGAARRRPWVSCRPCPAGPACPGRRPVGSDYERRRNCRMVLLRLGLEQKCNHILRTQQQVLEYMGLKCVTFKNRTRKY